MQQYLLEARMFEVLSILSDAPTNETMMYSFESRETKKEENPIHSLQAINRQRKANKTIGAQ